MEVLKVAITGGIGAGKSFVCSIFKTMGIPVYDSDKKAKKIMRKNKEVVSQIKEIFGNSIYDEEGYLKNKEVADQIFHDTRKLKAINGVVHPAVRTHFLKWAHKRNDVPFVLNEAALFVENGTYKDFDKLISVVSPLELRLERVIKRDNLSKIDILARMANQSTDEQKIKVSDYVIYNDHTELLIQQCIIIYKELKNFQKTS